MLGAKRYARRRYVIGWTGIESSACLGVGGPEQIDDVLDPRNAEDRCLFLRGRVLVDSRPGVRVSTVLEQESHGFRIPGLCHGAMKRCVVVDAPLIGVGSEGEQELQNLEHARGVFAAQGRDERRKPCGVFVVWIGAQIQQRAHERHRAVVDGTL